MQRLHKFRASFALRFNTGQGRCSKVSEGKPENRSPAIRNRRFAHPGPMAARNDSRNLEVCSLRLCEEIGETPVDARRDIK